MKFIKLTLAASEKEVFINMEQCHGFGPPTEEDLTQEPRTKTVLYMVGETFSVRESVDDILRVM